jgi:hypothetical protein
VYATAGSFAGSVTASSGSIGGNAIDATGIQSPGYAAPSTGWRLQSDGRIFAHGAINGGSYTGYAWPATGTGYHISKDGALFGNATPGQGGRYFQILNGDVYAPQFSIVGGVANFAGALNAASGSFAGALSAATGTFSGTLTAQVVQTANIVGAAVTNAFSATGAADPNTGPSVVVNVASGDRSIIIIADAGYGSWNNDGTTIYAPNNCYIYINGTGTYGGIALAHAGIQDPAPGTYTVQLRRSAASTNFSMYGNATLIVLHTKR